MTRTNQRTEHVYLGYGPSLLGDESLKLVKFLFLRVQRNKTENEANIQPSSPSKLGKYRSYYIADGEISLSGTQRDYYYLENSPKNTRADWLKHRTSTSCWRNGGASKENLHFHNQSWQVVFLFSSRCFLKEIKKKHVLRVSILRLVFHSISRSPKLPLVFLLNN